MLYCIREYELTFILIAPFKELKPYSTERYATRL